MKDADVASKIFNKAGELNKKLGGEKGNLSTTKKARKNNKDIIDGYTKEIRAIKKYRDRISVVEEGTKTLKVGKGIESHFINILISMKGFKFVETLKVTFEKLVW